MRMTGNQVFLVRSALGLGHGDEAKRNSHTSTQRLTEWENLVAAGHATSRIQRSLYGDFRIVYSATKATAEAVLKGDEYLNPVLFDEEVA